MRPRIATLEGEVIRVGDDTAGRGPVLEHPVGDAVALAVGDCLLDGIKSQLHLLAHVSELVQPMSGSIWRGSSGS